MNQYFLFILLVFTDYRLSGMIAYESGPFDVFIKVRAFFGKRANNPLWKTIADLLNCPYCLGIWISAVETAIALRPLTIPGYLCWFLGIAGAQAFLQSLEVER